MKLPGLRTRRTSKRNTLKLIVWAVVLLLFLSLPRALGREVVFLVNLHGLGQPLKESVHTWANHGPNRHAHAEAGKQSRFT